MSRVRKTLFLWVFLGYMVVLETQAQKVKVIELEKLETLMKPTKGVSIINFWATWCKPCVKEIPHFETLAKNFRQNEINIVLVSLDFVKDLEAVKHFVKENKVKSKVLLLNEPDYDVWINRVNENWTGAIPATLITDGKKTVFYEQPFDYQTLSDTVRHFF